jgi:hypothetical protein
MTSASPIGSRTDTGPTADPTDASNIVLIDGRWPLTADPRPAFAECAGLARSVVRGPLGDPEAPTPSGMTVQELVPHLVMAMRRAAASGKGIPFFEWPEEAPDVNLSNAVASVDRASTRWPKPGATTARSTNPARCLGSNRPRDGNR